MVAGLPQADGSLELISMWVDPLYRGKGVAAALVTTLVNWAEQSRYSPVTLRVHPENARALGFYRGFGFRDQHLNEEGDLVMQLFQ
jgi:ribosomal protein S18 acetylase RimI-like enzyme